VKHTGSLTHPLLAAFTRRESLALLAAAAGLLLPWRPRAAPLAAANPLLLDTPKSPVQALDFMGITAAGKPIRLSDLRGHVVLLNFWATWCVPCLEEMPAMDRLNRLLQGKKFRILAINLQETAEQVQQFAKSNRFSFDLVLDPAGEISHHYGVLRIPVSYIVEQKGYIIRRAVGSRAWDSKESVAFFTGLLSAPSAQTAAPEPASATAAPQPRKPWPGRRE
jgi:peroxiredoxin